VKFDENVERSRGNTVERGRSIEIRVLIENGPIGKQTS
jgi:hypothetical protein